jgi:hypothetical protein
MSADEDTKAPSPNDLATEQATRFAEAADKIRTRSETAAKGLAAVGTTAVGAVGIAKFADVFPIPDNHGFLLVAVIAGFVMMTIAVVLFSARLWRVSRPVYMRSDLAAVLGELDNDGERNAVRAAFGEAARTNDASSLRAYEARGWRLRRIALRQSNEAQRNSLLEQSTLILTDVRTTQLRAAIIVIRKRASSVASGLWTWVIVGLFAVGLIAVGVGADWLDSARNEDSRRLTDAQACASALEAITKQRLDPAQLLPGSCGQPETSTATAPERSAAEQIATTLDALTEHYRACVDQVIERGGRDISACDPDLQVIIQTGP